MTSILEPPCSYGKYELLERIGAGGMAEVYRARMPGLAGFAKTVVIKRLHPRYAGLDEYVQMFVDEAKLAAQVQHKNVVQVFELESLGPGELHMAMEWVDGIDLKRLLRAAAARGQHVPPWLCVHIMTEVLEALAYAHDLTDDRGRRRNIVHCDVTPENIFLSRLGDVKLADFGVASDDTRTAAPFDGQVKGKVPYLSPEQISSQKPDHRADVFACGIVLWESLTLHRLFAAGTPTETMSRICMARRAPPSSLAPEIPATLDRAVLQALEPNVEHRTQSARAFKATLMDVLAGMRPRLGLPDIGEALRDICGEEALRGPPRPIRRELEIDVDCAASSVDLLDDEEESHVGFDTQLGEMIADLLPRTKAPPPIPDATPEDEAFADAFDPSEDMTVAAVGWPPPLDEVPDPLSLKRLSAPADGFTYSIIKPSHAVDELGSVPPTPIPMRGSGAVVETGDLLRHRSGHVTAPIPAIPGRLNTRDVLQRPSTLPPGTLLLRSAQRTLGPVGALDVIGALADMLDARTAPDAEISGDGYRWMPWARFGELIGERIIESTAALPQHEFGGALENHSLTSLFGELSRSRATGCLVLVRHTNRGVERREIAVHRGMLTGVASSQQQFAAWSAIIHNPLHQPPRIADYVQQVAALATPLWELAPADVVTTIAAGRAKVSQEILKRVFTWSVGHFGFEPHDTPRVATTAPIPLMSVLPGIVSRTKTPMMLRTSLMRFLDTALVRSRRFTDEVGELKLQLAPRQVVGTFGDGRTLGESLASCATSKDEKIALVVGYLLLELGLVRPAADAHTPVQ